MDSKRITSQKKAIAKFEEGFRLEALRNESRTLYYYFTNCKDTEITVAKSVVYALIDKGIVDRNLDYQKHKINN